ncbi:hypothetical protein M9H77_05769 [Catharanthus roseus]|uniref:Uncharacterized protein n=1 Tax=Catharanthus roseus TaxID=4058 RepID=A0ACC0CI12_CATRO|nr:hypothetical protein M9H77_05769 [Catharanthus roseus]
MGFGLGVEVGNGGCAMVTMLGDGADSMAMCHHRVAHLRYSALQKSSTHVDMAMEQSSSIRLSHNQQTPTTYGSATWAGEEQFPFLTQSTNPRLDLMQIWQYLLFPEYTVVQRPALINPDFRILPST